MRVLSERHFVKTIFHSSFTLQFLTSSSSSLSSIFCFSFSSLYPRSLECLWKCRVGESKRGVENVKMVWVEFLEGDIDFLMHTHIWEVNIVRIYTFEHRKILIPCLTMRRIHILHKNIAFHFLIRTSTMRKNSSFLTFTPFLRTLVTLFPSSRSPLLHARIILSFFALVRTRVKWWLEGRQEVLFGYGKRVRIFFRYLLQVSQWTSFALASSL